MGVTLAGLLGGDVGSGVDQARRGDGGQCQAMRGTLSLIVNFQVKTVFFSHIKPASSK